MNINYKTVTSTKEPLPVESEVGTVFLRKDIVKEERTYELDGETLTAVIYRYQEAILTPEEFNEYSNLLMAESAIKGANDSDNIVQIMAGQETGDSNQLAIMEAIADLYDAVASMTITE